eukprot:COSAG06_NODE_4429_length_4277_cov_3.529201_4_plen_91_part_00
MRALGGVAYSSRAAPKVPTKGHTASARAWPPTRSCAFAKALTITHPGVTGIDSKFACSQKFYVYVYVVEHFVSCHPDSRLHKYGPVLPNY